MQVTGAVGARPEGTENSKLATGEVEVGAASLTILNQAKTPPFNINEDADVDEALRLQYRYLDLRKERMQANLGLRRKVVKFIRDYLDERGFWEIETPVLVKSTPEGARDYLVPSRLSPGEFYALPQSPQQLKQLLMVAGLERYYQIARCFRDEDQRADRQPEFTQLDLEMSFVEEADILDLIEGLFAGLVAKTAPHLKVVTPFPRLSFSEVMDRFGTEKPDLRFGMELADLTDVARETGLNVFKNVANAGGVVKGFAAPGCADYSRRQIDELIEFVKIRGAQGLVPIGLGAPPADLTDDDVKSPVAKFLTVDQVRTIAERTGAEKDGLVLIVAADETVANTALSQLRVEMGRRLGMIDENAMGFAFVVDFPLVEWNEDEGRWDALHHPFTAPHPDDAGLLETEPGKVRARAYDCVAQGVELLSAASGSTTGRSRSACSQRSATPPPTSRPGSGTCSGPSSTARRPTAAWPPASTASSCSSQEPRPSVRSSPSPRPKPPPTSCWTRPRRSTKPSFATFTSASWSRLPARAVRPPPLAPLFQRWRKSRRLIYLIGRLAG